MRQQRWISVSSLALTALAAVIMVSCVGAAPHPTASDDPAPPSSRDGSETGEPAPIYAEGQRCSTSDQCSGDRVCVAPYDSAADSPLGQAICVPNCVKKYDLRRFCVDDVGCCGPLGCSLDGLCEPVNEPPSPDPRDSETDESDSSGA